MGEDFGDEVDEAMDDDMVGGSDSDGETGGL